MRKALSHTNIKDWVHEKGSLTQTSTTKTLSQHDKEKRGSERGTREGSEGVREGSERGPRGVREGSEWGPRGVRGVCVVCMNVCEHAYVCMCLCVWCVHVCMCVCACGVCMCVCASKNMVCVFVRVVCVCVYVC